MTKEYEQYEQYEHHGNTVWVCKKLKGKHRDMCLCHSCEKLNVSDRQKNCKIASELFNICITHKLVTPVFECPEFVEIARGLWELLGSNPTVHLAER
jgi:hypothetical protein